MVRLSNSMFHVERTLYLLLTSRSLVAAISARQGCSLLANITLSLWITLLPHRNSRISSHLPGHVSHCYTCLTRYTCDPPSLMTG